MPALGNIVMRVLLLFALVAAAWALHNVNLPLKGGQVTLLTGGRREYQYSARLRWDLDYRYWLVGSQASQLYTKQSTTYDEYSRSELVQLGQHTLQLPCLLFVDLPSRDSSLTPIPDQGHTESLLPMGPNGPLWQFFHQFQLSERRLTLGTYRLGAHQHHTHHELHTNGEVFCSAVLIDHQWTPYRVVVNLTSDYTRLPISLYSQFSGVKRTALRMHIGTVSPLDRRHLPIALVVDSLHPAQRLQLDAASSLYLGHGANISGNLLPLDMRFATEAAALLACKVNASVTELLQLGRFDTQNTFQYGRDLLLDMTSLSWHIVQPSTNGPVTNEYLWLMLVLVPLIALWYLTVYESRWMNLLVDVIHNGYQAQQVPRPNSLHQLLSAQNLAFRRDLCVFTQVAVACVSAMILLIYRVDTNMQGLLVNAAYSAACVYLAVALAVLLACCGPHLSLHYTPTSVVEMSNALLWSVWLVSSAQSHQFFIGMLMLVCNCLVVQRDLEQWLLLAHFRLAPMELYSRQWLLWLVWLTFRTGSSCFLLGGYTLPLFVELHWPDNGFNALFELMTFSLLITLAFNTVGNQLLLVSRERNLWMADQLSKRPVEILPTGHYRLTEPISIKL